jgi:hypothetical protein
MSIHYADYIRINYNNKCADVAILKRAGLELGTTVVHRELSRHLQYRP